MPLYEYYCEPCNGIFEHVRQMRDASEPATCPVCSREAPRIPSTFSAFTFRDGYPRRIPDKGTYWHMGKEVKARAKRMVGNTHPELAEPKRPQRAAKGDAQTAMEKMVAERQDLRYRGKWGVNKDGFRTGKAVPRKKPERKVV